MKTHFCHPFFHFSLTFSLAPKKEHFLMKSDSKRITPHLSTQFAYTSAIPLEHLLYFSNTDVIRIASRSSLEFISIVLLCVVAVFLLDWFVSIDNCYMISIFMCMHFWKLFESIAVFLAHKTKQFSHR